LPCLNQDVIVEGQVLQPELGQGALGKLCLALCQTHPKNKIVDFSAASRLVRADVLPLQARGVGISELVLGICCLSLLDGNLCERAMNRQGLYWLA
jgi:hypothetical protein